MKSFSGPPSLGPAIWHRASLFWIHRLQIWAFVPTHLSVETPSGTTYLDLDRFSLSLYRDIYTCKTWSQRDRHMLYTYYAVFVRGGIIFQSNFAGAELWESKATVGILQCLMWQMSGLFKVKVAWEQKIMKFSLNFPFCPTMGRNARHMTGDYCIEISCSSISVYELSAASYFYGPKTWCGERREVYINTT